jgi:hypothetical protein
MNNQKYYFPAFICLLFALHSLEAQSFEPLSIAGIVDGKNLTNPFSGGLNSPQFNSIDFDDDGQDELCVFDRTGQVILPFFWENGSWIHQPDWASVFPEVQGWMILRDYNDDGIQDLFAYSDVPGIDGILVYKGYYENDRIAFERIDFGEAFNVLFFELPGGSRTNLRVTKIDYPAIDDLDCDGDLDVLTFNVSGGQIELYRNLSVEEGFGKDTILLKLVDFCWGGIFETGFTEEINLASAPGECATPSDQNIVEFRHAGSTILTMDIDNDGDKDAILGDLSFDNLNFLKNDGDCSDAWISQQDINFPSNTVPVDIFSFPAAFWIDADRDGLKDLIAAPNLARGGEDRRVAWLYQNTTDNQTPVFEYQNDRFLVEEMIDLGSNAHPAFVDVDQDGLMDLVVGNAGIFNDLEISQSGLFYFQNVGTESQAIFELVDSNFLNMNQFNPDAFNFTPTFGDVDGDRDLDIIVGEEGGGLFYAENTAGPDAPLTFGPWQYSFQNINVGLSSTPQLFDLNEDGLLDLIVGEKDGNINFFQNEGTADEPVFNPDPEQTPNNFFLGRVDTRRPGFIQGASYPYFFYDDSRLLLLTGTENSGLELYDDIQGRLEEAFSFSESSADLPHSGFQTAPALADINGDGLLEMVVGNERGGLSFFSTPWKSSQLTSVGEVRERKLFTVFPNPVNQKLRILRSESTGWEPWQLELYGLNGQLMKAGKFEGMSFDWEVSDLSAGMYLLKVLSPEGVRSQKIVIQH